MARGTRQPPVQAWTEDRGTDRHMRIWMDRRDWTIWRVHAYWSLGDIMVRELVFESNEEKREMWWNSLKSLAQLTESELEELLDEAGRK